MKAALEINPNLKLFASPWSPPGWMKTTDSLVRGEMKTEYIPILAKYFRKAVEAYAQLAQKNNTMIVPGNMTEVSALIGTAMTLMKGKAAGAP